MNLIYRQYESWNPQPETVETLKQAKEIILHYAEQGYDLTLRQLYYQLVSKDYIPNQEREYNRLGRIVSKGRQAGMLPWNVIEDRERSVYRLPTYSDPSDVIDEAAGRFHMDRLRGQPRRVEVWVEKKALQSVVRGPANRWGLRYFPCKGYASDTSLWNAAQRHRRHWEKRSQGVTVLHLGDMDPSGVNMTEDITERLVQYGAHQTVVRRIALNPEQVQEYNPPPQPAKESDSRHADFVEKYGEHSYELDALDPEVITDLINKHVREILDVDLWTEKMREEQEHTETLEAVAEEYEWIQDRIE